MIGLAIPWLALAAMGCDDGGSDSWSEADVGECGGGTLPDCPTQAFMKATMLAHLRAGDFPRLALTFDLLAEQAPAGYAEWRPIAEEGARAARREDDEGVRDACKRCHDSQRERFKIELRRRQIFGANGRLDRDGAGRP
jgi:hypothetical protein